MRNAKYQCFDLDEYSSRLSALRQRMEARGMDAMLVAGPENLFYLSGYHTPGYYWFQTLIVRLEGDPVFVTRLIESTNIEPLSWVEDSRPYQDHEDWIAHTAGVLKDLGLDRKSLGIDYSSFFITARDVQRFTEVMPDARFVDSAGLVEEGRIVKSPREIEYLRQAAKAAEAALKAGIEACEVGITENEVAAEMHRAQILAGSEYTGLPIFIRTGSRDSQIHATWLRNTLEAGDSITMEVPGCINRYHAALYGHVHLGDPPDILLRASEIGHKVMKIAKDAIKPGVPAGDVHSLVQDSLQDMFGSMSRRASRTAYSMGIAFAPDWGEGQILSMTEGERRPLQAGMAFHLLAGHVTFDGEEQVKRSCNSDTILVTPDGCETLTSGVEHKIYVK